METSFFLNNTSFRVSLLLMALSMLSFRMQKEKLSLLFLFFGTLTLGFFMAGLDPFINLWDEQFHALVAKNFIRHLLRPVLIEEPLFGFQNSYWGYCNIWLHKQPLFLWQMALSMKLFGANELALRLPSVAMHAALVFFVYRMGRLFVSKNVGYYSALFFSCAYFPLEYVTGFYPTDHNDVAFFFYSFASFWALAEYYRSPKTIFLILLGVLSGCAILCKWLTGLLPYLVWFICICYNYKQQPLLKNISRLLLSLLVCVIAFLPWQLFAYLHYPQEYRHGMEFNQRHILEPLEGHGGNHLFYYDALFEQFGEGLLIPPLIIACFVYLLYTIKDKSYRLLIFSTVFITYLFFTLVATKMYGYVFVALPFFIMGMACVTDAVLNKIHLKNNYLRQAVSSLLLVGVMFLVFNEHKIYKNHSNKDRAPGRLADVREKYLYQSLKEKFGDQKCLVFNCNTSFASHIIGIFYTDYPCFNYVLKPEQVQQAEAMQYKLFAIDDGKLPEYVLNNPAVVKLKF